jgi:hypothetical protein
MATPILNTPTPNQQKLEVLRQLFPQAVETDANGRIRVNAAQLQLALDPANPAGTQVEEDGYELRWVGNRYARAGAGRADGNGNRQNVYVYRDDSQVAQRQENL